jgi:hypothetical protein
MKNRLIDWVKKLRDPGNMNAREQLYIFLICLFISIFIWFLIVLSKETFTTIDYPIVFENTPNDLVLVNKPDSVLSFRVSSGGFELIILKYLTRKHPIRIDLNALELDNDGKVQTAVYSTSKISQDIIRDLNISQEYVSISPANIYFRFESLYGKKVQVISALKLNFEKQFQLSDSLKFNPDSIMLIGPQKVLQKIDFIETTDHEINQINQSQTVKVGLKMPGKSNNINILQDEVEVSITVDKYTESTLKIPITNVTEDYKIKTYPAFVNVTYLVTLENFNRVNEEMFTAAVNYSEGITSGKLPVDLLHQPTFIKVTRIEPEEVEFLLLKR